MAFVVKRIGKFLIIKIDRKIVKQPIGIESIFLSRVGGRGFHVEGEGIQCRGSRVLINKEKLNRIIKND